MESVNLMTSSTEPRLVVRPVRPLLLWCWSALAVLLFVAVICVAATKSANNNQLRGELQRRADPPIPPLTDEQFSHCPYFSPTFPSRGGADCACECRTGTQSVGAAFFNVFPRSFNNRVRAAGELVTAFGPDSTTYVEGEHGFMDSHISFAYYCCHTQPQRDIIKRTLEGWKWRPRRVGFSHFTCAIDGPDREHVSLILMLDPPSNRAMYAEIEDVEAAIEAAGVRLNNRRREQEPFHTTLAVVNGSAYPVAAAVAALNVRFAGQWERVTLRRPCQKHGETPAGFFC